MPCCLFYSHLAFQRDPKRFSIAFWVSSHKSKSLKWPCLKRKKKTYRTCQPPQFLHRILVPVQFQANFISTMHVTKLWIFSILTGQQKHDISYRRHLLLHNDRISLRETWLSLPSSVICNPRGMFTSTEKIPWPIQCSNEYNLHMLKGFLTS